MANPNGCWSGENRVPGLFLHGGPGMPSMYLSRLWIDGLERDMLLVQWDRYGAGKSWTRRRKTGRLRTSRDVEDAIILITQLQEIHRAGRIIVLGHSYRAYLAVALARNAGFAGGGMAAELSLSKCQAGVWAERSTS